MLFRRQLQTENGSGKSTNASGGCSYREGSDGFNLECIGIGLLIVVVVGMVIWILVRLVRYLKHAQLFSLKKSIESKELGDTSQPKIDPQNLHTSTRRPKVVGQSPSKGEQNLDTSGTYRADMSQFPDEDEPVVFITLTRTVFDHYVKKKVFGADFRDKFQTRL